MYSFKLCVLYKLRGNILYSIFGRAITICGALDMSLILLSQKFDVASKIILNFGYSNSIFDGCTIHSSTKETKRWNTLKEKKIDEVKQHYTI